MNGPAQKTLPRIRQAQPWWIQLIVLLVVFVAGGVVGGMIAMKSVHSRMAYLRKNPDALPTIVVPRLQHILALTEEQSAQVREIMSRRHPRIIEHSHQGIEGMHSEFDAMEEEIAAVLDEDQASKWRVVAEGVRSRFLPRATDEVFEK